MATLNFYIYIKRTGKKLPSAQREVFERAKEELRELHRRPHRQDRLADPWRELPGHATPLRDPGENAGQAAPASSAISDKGTFAWPHAIGFSQGPSPAWFASLRWRPWPDRPPVPVARRTQERQARTGSPQPVRVCSAATDEHVMKYSGLEPKTHIGLHP
jgi:hypothetical protein